MADLIQMPGTPTSPVTLLHQTAADENLKAVVIIKVGKDDCHDVVWSGMSLATLAHAALMMFTTTQRAMRGETGEVIKSNG